MLLNGHEIDLAYVFVRARGGSFVNLARLSGCEATDVSEQLVVGDANNAPGALGSSAPYQNTQQFVAPPPVGMPVVAAPPVVAPPPVAPPAPQGLVFRYAGRVVTTSGTAPTLPGASCTVQVQQVTNSQHNNCRVEITCGGQTLYGRANSGFGVCGFNSVRTGLIFRSTTTTVTMQDQRTTTQDGDPSLRLSLPGGVVVVQDVLSPVNVWTVGLGGFRQL